MSEMKEITVEISDELYRSIDEGKGVPPRSIRLHAERAHDVSADADSDAVNFVVEGAIAKFGDNSAPTE